MKRKSLPTKTAWHTDVVVKGLGFNVVVYGDRDGDTWTFDLKPDVRGKMSEQAAIEFFGSAGGGDWANSFAARKAVELAIRKTRARWNGWHREDY